LEIMLAVACAQNLKSRRSGRNRNMLSAGTEPAQQVLDPVDTRPRGGSRTSALSAQHPTLCSSSESNLSVNRYTWDVCVMAFRAVRREMGCQFSSVNAA